MIKRNLTQSIRSRFFSKKVIILSGARQIGKTTLINQIMEEFSSDVLYLDGDNIDIRNMLESINTVELRQLIGHKKVIFIDEAQRIDYIGITTKIIVDQIKNVQVILSGSSSFDLNNEISESLTGRKWTFYLYPVSYEEWENHVGFLEAKQDLENRLIFGLYPNVLNHREDQIRVLKELETSHLYKDILSFGKIRKPAVLRKLVTALAYQIGHEVVEKQIGDLIGLDPKTVENYIDILEKSYVVFRLPSLAKNLRNEIKKNKKIYFYDNGVRNTVIDEFRPIPNRNDIGQLWENFLVSERMKQNSYNRRLNTSFFWRTKQKQEVDYVEQYGDKYYGFELKWNPKRVKVLPKTFMNAYRAEGITIHRENYRDFIVSNLSS